jgi:ATP phosphoribosyltransferase
MLRLALPNKGRLAEQTLELLDSAGLALPMTSERALTARVGEELEVLFVRAQDIPEFVADGAAHAGVTGWDLVAESGRELCARLDLGFGRCRLVAAAREDSPVRDVAQVPAGARVATAFPNLARRWFAEAGREVEIVPVSGASEAAPHLGIAELIVDLVSTGSTLRVNGLCEIATLLHSSARLVTAPAPAPALVEPLEDLVATLASVVRARGRRYVMANVPKAALDRIPKVLPGLNGPTVTAILNSGAHVAVHAVVAADALASTLRELKALGAEGILVTRIERLTP